MKRKIIIFTTVFCFILTAFLSNSCKNKNLKSEKEIQIEKVLDLVGQPSEWLLTPMDSIGISTEEGLKFMAPYMEEINRSVSKNGIANGNLLNIMDKYSEILRLKNWDFCLKDSNITLLDISEVQKQLGKEMSIEKGEYNGTKRKFPLIWHNYQGICFGVDDHSKIRVIRGIYSYPKNPYVRLADNSTIKATFNPKLLLFKSKDSLFYLISSQSIKNIVRLPKSGLQNSRNLPLFEFENDSTRIVIARVKDEQLIKSGLIDFVYKQMEKQYNSSLSYGSYWAVGYDISGATFENTRLKRGVTVAFADSILTLKDSMGVLKKIPVSDFISFFR